MKDIKLAILSKFDTQADFAQALGVDDSVVSRVIRGRRKLSQIEVEVWKRALCCDSDLLKAATNTKLECGEIFLSS